MSEKIFITPAWGAEFQYLKELSGGKVENIKIKRHFAGSEIKPIPAQNKRSYDFSGVCRTTLRFFCPALLKASSILRIKFLLSILFILIIILATTIFIKKHNQENQTSTSQRSGILLKRNTTIITTGTLTKSTQEIKQTLAPRPPIKKITEHNGNAPFSGYDTKGIENIVKEVEESKEQWRKDAEQRINKYRKANLTVKVVNAKNGKPVPRSEIEIKLIRHNFKFGGIINASKYIKNEKLHKSAMLNMGFNASGFNNTLKYKLRRSIRKTHPEEIIAWLLQHNIAVRGHCLIWPGRSKGGTHMPGELAKLVEKYLASPSEELKSKIRECSYRIVSEWAAKWDVSEWDVLNEPRNNHLVQKIVGNEIEAEWFKIAKKNLKNPNARLCLNENCVISGKPPKGKKGNKHKGKKRKNVYGVKTMQVMTYYNTVKELLKNKAPLGALAFQSRYSSMTPPETIYKRLQVFDEFNLPIVGSEFEMQASVGNDMDKARMTERVMTIYFSHRLVDSLYVWTVFPDKYHKEILDEKGFPNLKGKVWLYLTKNRWNTHVKTYSDNNGNAVIRGFKGTYEITVTVNGRKKTVKTTLIKDKTLKIKI